MILNLTRHITLVCLVVIPFLGSAQKNPNDHISIGNSLYDEGKFGEAEVSYKDGQTEGADPFISGFNLGDALFKQERFEEAATAFQALPNLTEDKEQKAAAYHNLGNSFIKAEKFQEGVDAYKQSLRNNPKDLETKYNLAYAKRMLQQQQEQEQKQDQEKKDDKEQKQDQQKQDQKKEENEEKKDDQQQQQNQQRQDEEEQKEQEQPEQSEISKEDAERMLDALNQDEKEIRDRLEKQKVKKGTKGKIEKDW